MRCECGRPATGTGTHRIDADPLARSRCSAVLWALRGNAHSPAIMVLPVAAGGGPCAWPRWRRTSANMVDRRPRTADGTLREGERVGAGAVAQALQCAGTWVAERRISLGVRCARITGSHGFPHDQGQGVSSLDGTGIPIPTGCPGRVVRRPVDAPATGCTTSIYPRLLESRRPRPAEWRALRSRPTVRQAGAGEGQGRIASWHHAVARQPAGAGAVDAPAIRA